jgi:methylamine---glutamate N-methyltransferase subunit C
MDLKNIPQTLPRQSATFDPYTMSEIRRAAATGIYDIRGAGTKRALPHFDDLLFLGASISRYPLEGYREKCATDVWLGTRFAKKPIHLKTPVTIAGMSFGSLSAQAKEALGRGASIAGTSTTTGDGGMTPEERSQSQTLIYQYLPSRYGMNPDDLRKAPSPVAVACCWVRRFPIASRKCVTCPWVSISVQPAAIPIGQALTI